MLKAILTDTDSQVPTHLVDAALRYARWEVPPPFKRPGRTGWASVEINGEIFTIKLKGVGLWNPSDTNLYGGVRGLPRSEQPLPPSSLPYQTKSDQSHFGFSPKGYFEMLRGASTPVGGILHSKAVSEFRCATALRLRQIPSIAPCAVVKYTDLRFEGNSMGAVISVAPDSYPFGLESILYYPVCRYPAIYDFMEGLRNSLGLPTGDINQATTRLETLEIIYKMIGRLIRSFSESGLYRHSGGLNNFFFSRQHATPYLSDLDSSLELGNIKLEIRWLQIARDICSVLHKLMLHLVSLVRVGNYTVNEVRRFDLVVSVLSGYFFEVKTHELTRFSEIIWKLWEQDLHTQVCGNSGRLERDGDFLVSRDVFYSICLIHLRRIYLRTTLVDFFPIFESEETITNRAATMLGNRFKLTSPFLY